MKSLFYYFVGFPKLHFTAGVSEYHARCKYSYFVLNCTFSRRKKGVKHTFWKKVFKLHFYSTNSSTLTRGPGSRSVH